jgi:predicted permease
VAIALAVVPDFLLIALGALLRRTAGFSPAFWAGVERLVYYVLFPALLFRALSSAPFDIASAAPVIATGVAFTLAGMALSLAGRPLLRLPDEVFAGCFQCAFRFNTYLALAVTASVAGERGVALVSLLIGLLVPLVNVAAVGMLVRGRALHVARAIATNPLVLACVAGIGWNLAGLPRPAVVMRIVDHLAAAALPLGLLAVGAGLAFQASTLPMRAIAWWNGTKLVVLPAIALVSAHALGLDATETRVVLVMAAVPTATSAYVLAVQLGAPGAPVALLISSGTALAAITLPLWVALAS